MSTESCTRWYQVVGAILKEKSKCLGTPQYGNPSAGRVTPAIVVCDLCAPSGILNLPISLVTWQLDRKVAKIMIKKRDNIM